MLYLWTLPENCPNKFIAVYDRETSPNRFLFKRGIKLVGEEANKRITFHVKIRKNEISKYDCIPNNANSPLIDQKIVDVLCKIAPDEIQFFDTDIQCKDGILTDYKLLNIIHNIKGIDHEKSIYTTMAPLDSAILGFKYITYKSGCMGAHKLARDEEYSSHLLVTEEVKQAFEKAKITGVNFVRPEEFYRPLT